jgi:type I restriction enzyme S subunit
MRWLYHLLCSYQLQKLSEATGVPSLARPTLYHLRVPRLSFAGQSATARVLDCVDRAIEETEALVAKQERIKAGMLHDLLTRGLDADGRLRDPATHRFKPSPLGPIPEEWEPSSCGAEFAIDAGITLGPSRVPKESPHAYLRVANVQRGRLVLDDLATLEATPSEVEAESLRIHDLLVVEGHADSAEIGRCAMVWRDAEGLLFQNHLFRLRALRLDPWLALSWLNATAARRYWIVNCATSSGLNTINREMLRRMPVPVPPVAEQGRIVAAVRAGRTREHDQQISLAKLRRLKAGLMEDLLTGRVPVTPLLEGDHD